MEQTMRYPSRKELKEELWELVCGGGFVYSITERQATRACSILDEHPCLASEPRHERDEELLEKELWVVDDFGHNTTDLLLHAACVFVAFSPSIESSLVWLRVIEKLIQAYPDALRVHDKTKYTPLHILLLRYHSFPLQSEFVRTMIQTDPSILKLTDGHGNLPIHHVFHESVPVDLIQTMIDAYPGSILISDYKGMLPLHRACRYNAPVDVVQLLLDKHRELNATCLPDRKKRLPLHYACENKCKEKIQLLLREYPDSAMVQDWKGQNALHLIFGTKIRRCKTSSTLAELTQLFDDQQCVQESGETKQVMIMTQQDRFGRTPLHELIRLNRLDKVALNKRQVMDTLRPFAAQLSAALNVTDENGLRPGQDEQNNNDEYHFLCQAVPLLERQSILQLKLDWLLDLERALEPLQGMQAAYIVHLWNMGDILECQPEMNDITGKLIELCDAV